MRICMISTRHSLDDARVIHKESKSLKAAGHEVILLFSCNSNYEYSSFDGTVITKGKAPNGATEIHGMKVYGLPKRNGILGKIKSYFELSSFAATLKADVYHAHEPDLSLAIAIRTKKLLKKQKHQALVLHDMHEYPPGSPFDRAIGMLKYITLYIYKFFDKHFIKNVDHIITANSIVRGYSLALSYQKTVDIIYNGPSLKLFPQSKPPIWDKESKLILCHEGSLGFNRGLKVLVSVVHKFKNRVRLKIIGDVFGAEREWLEKEIKKLNLEEAIERTGWLPYQKVGDALRDCHIGLILFRDCMQNRLAGPPNKLFNYMNAGLPVISVDFPEMRRIIQEEKCGLLIKDQSEKAIIDTLNQILTMPPTDIMTMGLKGQIAIKNRYSWEQMETILLSAYEKLEKN
ncbi:glycosyltransferase family 4 protein [Candidatus Margulisiibacteriota bacterium]